MKKIIENAIEQALIEKCKTKDFDDITVKELCDVCEISKPTFYKYYQDKYHVAERIYLKDAGLYGTKKPYFTQEEIRISLSRIWKKRTFYKKALSSRDQNSLYSFLAKHTMHILTDYISNCLHHSLTEEEKYQISFYSYGWIHSINEWIIGETHYSIDNLAMYQVDAIPEFLKDLLNHNNSSSYSPY